MSKNKQINLYILQKIFSKKKKIKKFAILKSPHIYKSAQEQFEYRIYSKKILINSFKPSIFLLVLKKIKSYKEMKPPRTYILVDLTR